MLKHIELEFLDKVIGFELSPLLWKNCSRLIGRKSSISCFKAFRRRERSIQKFIPEEYWEISFSATTNNDETISFNLTTKKTDPLLSKEKVETIKQQIESSNLSINEISRNL